MNRNFTFPICIILAGLIMSCNGVYEKQQTEKGSEEATAEQIEEETKQALEAITSKTGDTSENSLDWPGIYEGILPCSDCEGIKTTIELKDDRSYTIKEEYIGKGDIIEESGTFQWDIRGAVITFKSTSPIVRKYAVGEHKLLALDEHGNPMQGKNEDDYLLNQKQ